MMTMITAMMMNLLSGTKAIKHARHRKQIKRRALTYCMASQLCDGLVLVRRREEVVEVTDSGFKNYLR